MNQAASPPHQIQDDWDDVPSLDVKVGREETNTPVSHTTASTSDETEDSSSETECCNKQEDEPPKLASVQPSTTDDLIAEAMATLSIEDRTQVMKELHGTCTSSETIDWIEETPEFLEIKLLDLGEELQRCVEAQPRLAKALLLAQSQDARFVHDNRSLHLLVLRCCNYDIAQAALRLVRYFDWKLFLWGPDKLCQARIEWEDLSTDEQKLFKKGFLQILPQRDSAGRLMVLWCRCYNQFRTGFCFARLFWYMLQLENDPESSRKGVVFVVFKEPHVPVHTLNAKEIWMLVRTMSDTPIKTTAVHKCLSTGMSFVGRVMDNVVYMLDKHTKTRIQMHYGTYEKWMEELSTYGIPTHVIQFTKDKKIKLKTHQEWLQGRKAIEAMVNKKQPIEQLVEIPSNDDVLLGRGKPITTRPGNLKLQNTVDQFVTQYHSSSTKDQKTALAKAVLDHLTSTGSRFLSRETGVWAPVSDTAAREKVSGMFRHRRGEVQVVPSRPVEDAPDTKRSKVI